MDFDPPFQETYKMLLVNSLNIIATTTTTRGTDHDHDRDLDHDKLVMMEEFELPTIDLSHIIMSSTPQRLEMREKCIDEIVHAASNWGFFQVVNHGVSEEILKSLSYEQKKMFHQPFQKKSQNNFLKLSPNCYRWGNPKATCLKQLSWSEAFHISVPDISKVNECKNLRSTMEKFAKTAYCLAKSLAEILGENLGGYIERVYFQDKCPLSSSYLRLNRYPPCPYNKLDDDDDQMVFGLIPHTDSDFLSIVYQDQVGGLQLFKDGTWIAVKPNPQALVINIGDLFQALSNGVYRSVRHRVVASNSEAERFSAAYFYCPVEDATIESCSQPAVYKDFTFREYKSQNHKDVQDTGDKVGLQRFQLLGLL